MNSDSLVDNIRLLAKSNYWQTIYTQCKETNIKVFENDTKFTHLQILFLNYLQFYNSLFIEIAMGDVDSFVLDNYIYEDAYTYFRNKSRNKGREYDVTPAMEDNKKVKTQERSRILFRKSTKK